MPGLYRWGFFTPPVAGALFLGTLCPAVMVSSTSFWAPFHGSFGGMDTAPVYQGLMSSWACSLAISCSFSIWPFP